MAITWQSRQRPRLVGVEIPVGADDVIVIPAAVACAAEVLSWSRGGPTTMDTYAQLAFSTWDAHQADELTDESVYMLAVAAIMAGHECTSEDAAGAISMESGEADPVMVKIIVAAAWGQGHPRSPIQRRAWAVAMHGDPSRAQLTPIEMDAVAEWVWARDLVPKLPAI